MKLKPLLLAMSMVSASMHGAVANTCDDKLNLSCKSYLYTPAELDSRLKNYLTFIDNGNHKQNEIHYVMNVINNLYQREQNNPRSGDAGLHQVISSLNNVTIELRDSGSLNIDKNKPNTITLDLKKIQSTKLTVRQIVIHQALAILSFDKDRKDQIEKEYGDYLLKNGLIDKSEAFKYSLFNAFYIMNSAGGANNLAALFIDQLDIARHYPQAQLNDIERHHLKEKGFPHPERVMVEYEKFEPVDEWVTPPGQPPERKKRWVKHSISLMSALARNLDDWDVSIKSAHDATGKTYTKKQVKSAIRKASIQKTYDKLINQFESSSGGKVKSFYRNVTLAMAKREHRKGNISKEVFDMVKVGLSADFSSASQVQFKIPKISGYETRDIAVFTKVGMPIVMVLFGHDLRLLTFTDEDALYDWFVDRKNDQEIERHFTLYDNQDGMFHNGAHSSLREIRNGKKSKSDITLFQIDLFAHTLSQTGPVICTGTVAGCVRSFQEKDTYSQHNRFGDYMKTRLFERLRADGDTLILSDSERKTTHILTAVGLGLGAVAPFVPGLGPIIGETATVVAVGTTAFATLATQIGTHIWEAGWGDTEAERTSGIIGLMTDGVMVAGIAGGAAAGTIAKSGFNLSNFFSSEGVGVAENEFEMVELNSAQKSWINSKADNEWAPAFQTTRFGGHTYRVAAFDNIKLGSEETDLLLVEDDSGDLVAFRGSVDGEITIEADVHNQESPEIDTADIDETKGLPTLKESSNGHGYNAITFEGETYQLIDIPSEEASNVFARRLDNGEYEIINPTTKQKVGTYNPETEEYTAEPATTETTPEVETETPLTAEELAAKHAEVKTTIENITANKRVVVFSGFSGLGYENTEVLQAILSEILDNEITLYGQDNVVVVAGATGEGIGAVYEVARNKGLTRLGIVSEEAVPKYSSGLPDPDSFPSLTEKNDVFVPDPEGTWKVLDPNGESYMVTVAKGNEQFKGKFYAIGGGKVTLSELQEAKNLGIETEIYEDIEPNSTKVEERIAKDNSKGKITTRQELTAVKTYRKNQQINHEDNIEDILSGNSPVEIKPKSEAGKIALERQQQIFDQSGVTITPTESANLELYSYDSNTFVNNYLRYGKEHTIPAGYAGELIISETAAERGVDLAKIVNKLPESEAAVLYRGGSGARGTSGAVFRIGALNKGDILVNTDFLSFTENPGVIRDFAGVEMGKTGRQFDLTSIVFEINSPQKAKIFAPFSWRNDAGEAESIYNPGNAFRIVNIRRTSATFDGKEQPIVVVTLSEEPLPNPQVENGAIPPRITLGDRVYDFRTGETVDWGKFTSRYPIDAINVE
ncbi:dermonecrotic toxin domain-containing protein [Zooshikella harenae]|uniref:Dermonecrotic toxin N-terminal domain-containing protein n=1 Tax=Zooshikella harenae TaxID=2827238 RepID=A0ABS5ZHH5_9GAMM|nr:DUF6543 domain-containing protein [Zooshikella harenae]MBU2713514.1 hypothetical protein [Zooshikella harenae]